MKRLLLLLPLLAPAACSSDPDSFRVARIFADNMVLQRSAPVTVWGWARPGQKVTVKVADQTATTTAGAKGDWRVSVGPLTAGGPYEMKISGGGEVVFKNILVGDVYVCAGASNMEWQVAGAQNPAKEIESAQYPAIRHVTVPKGMSRTPLSDLPQVAWQECSPKTVGTWTATGYFFARSIHQKLGIPVGIINASWGGTTCEAWMSVEALETLPAFKGLAAKLAGGETVDYRAHEEQVAQWQKSLESLDKGSLPGGKSWADPALDDAGWKTMDLPQYWEKSELPAFDGVVWFRRKVYLPTEWAGHEVVLSLGPIDDSDVCFWNGERVGSTEGWNTPRRYRLPGASVKSGANLLAVRVNDSGGGGGFHGTPKEMMVEGPDLPLAGAWSYAIGMDLSQAPPRPAPPAFAGNPATPTGNYNAMIAPIIPYGIKGVVWYQGEANVGAADLYRAVFPLLIRDWRSRWGQGDFPFLFVQLANHRAVSATPGDSAWAELREAQAAGLSYPNTGMAVATDIGEAGDLHPQNKQEVGRRLARWILQTSYGGKDVPSGPLFESSDVVERRIRVKFKNVGGGLVAQGGPLKGFAIAGDDLKWEWADARIDGDGVVVSSSKVGKPTRVRYAWADNPEGCNLYNVEGLPAAPFRAEP